MARNDFSISISNEAVDVRFMPSAREPRGKLFGFLFTVSGIIALICAVLFLPGKNDRPGMWHDLTNAPLGPLGVSEIVILVCGVGFFGWFVVVRYARAAAPSDETFHCDRKAITLARIPWLDFSNRTWRSYTYPLAEVREIRFAVIASMRGTAFWGLRFQANGSQWALPGLEAPEAKTILAALRALGADAPEDPKLDKKVKQVLDERSGDTSWMDRSWMDRY